MPGNEIFVEERNGKYVALENGSVIAEAATQEECGQRAHQMRPSATIFGERQRETSAGDRDKWRVLHHPSR